jgi:hypothetical protein
MSPNFVRYGKGVEHVTEVAEQLLCEGKTIDEVFMWFARRLEIGPFAKVKA